MTLFKWLAAAALIGSASACVNTPYGYGNGYAYSRGAYDYNQQSTYYGNRQPTYYGYQQPTYYGYQQPIYNGYYGR
jgi:hypothetical protein